MDGELKEFLTRHEADLSAGIERLTAELADVHKAKVAIGMEAPEPRTAEGGAETLATNGAGASGDGAAEEIKKDSRTLKEMALISLTERFPEGAVVKDIVSFLNENSPREVKQTSLSSILSQLAADGILNHNSENGVWSLKR